MTIVIGCHQCHHRYSHWLSLVRQHLDHSSALISVGASPVFHLRTLVFRGRVNTDTKPACYMLEPFNQYTLKDGTQPCTHIYN